MNRREENIVYAGSKRSIEYAILANGKMPAREFFYGLSERDQNGLIVLFKLFGDFGEIRNRERFKRIEGTDFFEFKRFQTRFICFMQPGGKVILTHGFTKKRDKISPEEIRKAYRIKEEHLSREGEEK